MDILIKGKIANSYQLIGVFAAKEYLSEKYKAKVTLNVEYVQYWNRKNISDELVKMLAYVEEKKEYDRVFDIEVNHNYRFWSNSIITVDDGVGAYRKSFIKSYKTIEKENYFNNKPPINFTGKIKLFVRYLTTQTISLYPRSHISIFKKGVLNYFEINKENVIFFKKAIYTLGNETGFDLQLPTNSIVYLTQPKSLVWNSEAEYEEFLGSLLRYLTRKYENPIIYFKLHPMDDFDYSNLNVNIISSNIPAELVFSSSYRNISAVFGINSTSMLTGKILYNIDTYSVDFESINNLDFWAKKAFLRYIPTLNICLV